MVEQADLGVLIIVYSTVAVACACPPYVLKKFEALLFNVPLFCVALFFLGRP